MKMTLRCFVAVFTAFSLGIGCTSDPPAGGGAGGAGGEGGAGEPLVLGGDRPVTLHVPEGLDPKKPTPLVVLLHGYNASGFVEDLLFAFKPAALKRGYLYAHPDGTVNSDGKRFWNATDACCDFDKTGVDDVAYLGSLVDEIGQHYAVDPRQVYFIGHSNGGYMANRLGCDRADLVAAIGSLAGATWLDPSKCAPAEPIAALQIHGTEDPQVLYEGEAENGVGYPGAVATAESWAKLGGCEVTPEAGEAMDLIPAMDGAETGVSRYTLGCLPGGGAELWTVNGAGHVPAFGPAFAESLLDWFSAHPKP